MKQSIFITKSMIAGVLLAGSLSALFQGNAAQSAPSPEASLNGYTVTSCRETGRSVAAGMANNDLNNPNFVLIYRQTGKPDQAKHTQLPLTPKVEEFCRTGLAPA